MADIHRSFANSFILPKEDLIGKEDIEAGILRLRSDAAIMKRYDIKQKTELGDQFDRVADFLVTILARMS